MKQLNKPGDNLGGIISFWLVPPADVESIQNGILTLTTSDNVWQIYATAETIGFSEDESMERGGLTYEPNFEAFIPHADADRQAVIDQIRGRKFLVVFMDGNAYYRLVGTKGVPIRALVNTDTKKDTSGLAGFTFTISGKQKSPASFISNPFE